jgi:hypothetical protein
VGAEVGGRGLRKNNFSLQVISNAGKRERLKGLNPESHLVGDVGEVAKAQGRGVAEVRRGAPLFGVRRCWVGGGAPLPGIRRFWLQPPFLNGLVCNLLV